MNNDGTRAATPLPSLLRHRPRLTSFSSTSPTHLGDPFPLASTLLSSKFFPLVTKNDDLVLPAFLSPQIIFATVAQLGFRDLVAAMGVSTNWRNLCRSVRGWKFRKSTGPGVQVFLQRASALSRFGKKVEGLRGNNRARVFRVPKDPSPCVCEIRSLGDGVGGGGGAGFGRFKGASSRGIRVFFRTPRFHYYAQREINGLCQVKELG